MQHFEEDVESLLSLPPYVQEPERRQSQLLKILKEELDYASQQHPGYRNYIQNWPLDYRSVKRIEELPFLPVGILKADPPFALVGPEQIKRTLRSSATTSQVPSQVAVDASTARRMTKGVVTIVRDFIGPSRRPYLVVDTPSLMASKNGMGARAAAIQGLQPFASETFYCLSADDQGDLKLELDRLRDFTGSRREGELLIYSFTFILWNHLILPLLENGTCLNLPSARILHSGGWKRLQDQAVDKTTFNEQLAEVVGCSPSQVIDFYGLVETVGVIFPDCPAGNKHAPAFAEVIVRDPLTLHAVAPGQCGIIQVCSVLPSSFPGHLLLTEDMARVIAYDGCACGRRGISFRFEGRIPNAELRGCGNVKTSRSVN